MPRLEVKLEPTVRAESIVPADLRVRATLVNPGDEPVEFHAHQARHASLVLEVRDEQNRRILLPPPTPPDEHDLAPPDRLGPGESVELDFVNFLDAGLEGGTYRIRFATDRPPLGGDGGKPLESDWLEVSLVRADLPRGIAVGAPRKAIGPSIVLIGAIWLFLRRIFHRILCWIRRLLGRRCDRVHTQEVDEPREETITNAPPEAAAWNGTYGWRARFLLTVDEANCRATATVRVRLSGGAITDAQRAAWETAIEAAWSNRFKLCCHCCCCSGGYAIVADVQFVDSNEHQVVNVGPSTTNMGNWSAADTVDVRHEFGHMLGALDEYFTVNGTDFGAGRQPGGSIMNNPANDPAARHFDVILAAAQTLLGTTCTTRAAADPC